MDILFAITFAFWVELSEDEEEIVVVYPDEALEMHCDIPSTAPFKGRDVSYIVEGELILFDFNKKI